MIDRTIQAYSGSRKGAVDMASFGWTSLVVFGMALLLSEKTDAFLGKTYWHIRETAENNKRTTLMKNSVSKLTQVKTINLTQPLDHFNPYGMEDNITFTQRVMVNEDFWKRDGPVFLFISGENRMSEEYMIGGFYIELAKKYGALVVGVEHRFYGQSINEDGLKIKWLPYLNSQQALVDLTEVHTYITELYELNSTNIWICYGGSYAGSLAAWFRLKYPHLVAGAIASSAPVKAIVDFEEYNNIVARSYADPVVKGSPQCLRQISEAFSELDRLIKRKDLKRLEEEFKACGNISDPKDTVLFASTLAYLFMGVVQYNGQGFATVSTVCNEMTKTNKSYDNLVNLISLYRFVFNEPCIESSFDGHLELLKNTEVDYNSLYRQWTWQTCIQFGYYQTCNENTQCPFSKHMSVDQYLEACNEVFKLYDKEVYESVDFTNNYYGSDEPSASRIIFINGSIDPWSALSILEDLSRSQMAVYINGTSHCADFSPTEPNEPESLAEARQVIKQEVERWLTLRYQEIIVEI